MDVCLKARRLEARGSLQVVGLPEDEILAVACGGRLELPPERCALLEKRCVRLLDRVRSIMVEQYDEHCAFEVRLEKCVSEHPSVKPFVEKRRNMLSLYTEKELKRWFESSGYTSPDLHKTDEREAARGTRSETLARLQSHLQRLNYELQMGVAQRCRGWTPQT